MRMSSSATNFVKNTSKDTTDMIKVWLGAVPKSKQWQQFWFMAEEADSGKYKETV